ncbi:MAG TPA: polysaccharide deacetylase family protein [Chthonomonadaceae bacterium]|nr:polysaccharide deacetylase family protein [Chthonomonadaceae bacterium]
MKRGAPHFGRGRSRLIVVAAAGPAWIVTAALAGVLTSMAAGSVQAQDMPPPATPAEAAILQLTEGNYANAAQHLRQAMAPDPDDAVLNDAAGAVAISTGDPDTARTAFEHALHTDRDDSLALYGLGLTRLAKGDRSGALSAFDRCEAAGGDRAYLVMVRRYVQWLAGAQLAVDGAAAPDVLAPAKAALEGIEAESAGNWAVATARIQAALAALPGDPLVEPGGALMNFDPARPLLSGAPRLPAGSLTVAQEPGVLSGSVELSPDGSLDGVAYVSYELDGQPLGVVNVRPFTYALDTRRLKNGRHTLTIVLHDVAINELGRSSRKILVQNAAADTSDADLRSRERGEIWQALALRPGRCGGAYALGIAYRAIGQPATAQAWFARCLAIQPAYRDARKQWEACGGLSGAGEAIWGGLPTEKVIALTFDDGPKPGVTEPLLEILKQERVPATFFVIGKHVMEYPDLTRQIVESGMEIANHSYTHRNLTKLSALDVAREVMQTQAAVLSVTGRAPRFLRPPGGNWNPHVAQTARSWGLTPCMWTVDVYGSEVIGAQQVANAVLAQVRPGSIILMHNGKVSTLQALPTIIRALKSRGYAFATVDTLQRRLGASRIAAQAAETHARVE